MTLNSYDDEGMQTNINHFLYMLWTRLTKPAPQIQTDEHRRHASLLSSILVTTIFLSFFELIRRFVLGYGVGFYHVGFVVLVVSYGVSRTKYFRISALLVVLLAVSIPVEGILSSTTSDLASRYLFWFIIPIILASLLFRLHEVIAIGATVLLIILVSPFYQPLVSISDAFYYTSMGLVISALVLVSARIRQSDFKQILKHATILSTNQKELELYTSILRHDLANDLQVVMTRIEHASLITEANPEVASDSLESSLAAVRRMSNLLNAFTREAREFNDLVALIEYVSNQAEKAHPTLRIIINFEKTDRPGTFGGRLLPVVFENLFRNAAKHAGPEPTVMVSIEQMEDRILVEVSDNGPGIDSEIREHLFERRDSLRTQGIGLYLVKQIIESMGGTIKLVDNQTGTAFHITLPLR